MTYTTHLPDRHRNDPWKVPVRAASTANGTLATAFENGDTLDGVTLATGDRILLKNQSAGAENGVYVVQASGAPTRAADFDTQGDILGSVVVVTEGTANADTMWLCTTNATITVGSTALVFADVGGGTPDAHAASHEDGGSDEIDVTGLTGAAGSGYAEGTGFPGGPAADDKFLRTDRDLLYFYDGTRWLTVTLFSLPLPNAIVQPTSSTVTYHRAQVPYAAVYDLWLEDFQASFFVSGGTALGASHKWVVTLVKNPAGSTIATINIDSGASNAHRQSGQVAIDALVATTEFTFDTLATKTGTPGTLFLNPTVTYRMVG